MLKLIGIFNIVFFLSAITYFASKNRGFSIKKYEICYLASYRKTGVLFNISLFISSVSQVIFALIICNSMSTEFSIFSMPLFILGGIFLCLASIFPLNKYHKLHHFSAVLCAIFVSLGVLFLALGILEIHFILGLILLVVTCLILLSYLLRLFLPGGLYQIPMLTLVGVWNILFSVYLFGIVK
jgi:hypothetical membrane protein